MCLEKHFIVHLLPLKGRNVCIASFSVICCCYNKIPVVAAAAIVFLSKENFTDRQPWRFQGPIGLWVSFEFVKNGNNKEYKLKHFIFYML